MGYWLTIIGVCCKAVVDGLVGGSGGNDQAAMVNSLFTGLAVFFTLIGVLKGLLKSKGGRNKLITLGIHALIWVAGYFCVRWMLPLVIIVGVLLWLGQMMGLHVIEKIVAFVNKLRKSV